MCNAIPKVKIILLSALILFVVSTISKAVDFTYKIIDINRLGTIKCEITVRLNKRISEDALRKLAIELHTKEPKKYDRIFITYYLPGMTVGAGAWATTHFNPNLDVRILGMTIEEEKYLLKKEKKISGKIIGAWVNKLYGKYTITKKGSDYVLETKYKDGSGSTKDLINYKFHGKMAFKEKGENSGDYFVIEDSGDLKFYDSLGLFISMRAIK
jgi:hypothetical protein